MDAPKSGNERYTYGDYVKWPEDERWELIEGRAYAMTFDAPETKEGHYTYADYAKWPEGERWELIEGKAYAMPPSQTTRHQQISMNLCMMLCPYFQSKQFMILAAPLDVLLPKGDESDEDIESVVQPDLLVVCDPAKLKENYVLGAPDLVIEIMSNESAGHDMKNKLFLYGRCGVRCYIIVDPWGKLLYARYSKPEGGFGTTDFFQGNDKGAVRIFDGLVLDVVRVFEGI